jgi:hypothetical protein
MCNKLEALHKTGVSCQDKHSSLFNPLVELRREWSVMSTTFDEVCIKQIGLFKIENEPIKLECYIQLGWRALPGTNTPAYWTH